MKTDMKCPECVKEGKRSIVFDPMTSALTGMGSRAHFDEDGKYHIHDLNTHTTEYSCSDGHEWVDTYRRKCWCGWESR